MKATTAPPKTTEEFQQPTTWIARVNLGRQMRDAGEKMIADALRERLDKVGEARWLVEVDKEWGWSRTTAYRHLNPELLQKDRDRAAARYENRNIEEQITKAFGAPTIKAIQAGRVRVVPDCAGDMTILQKVEPETDVEYAPSAEAAVLPEPTEPRGELTQTEFPPITWKRWSSSRSVEELRVTVYPPSVTLTPRDFDFRPPGTVALSTGNGVDHACIEIPTGKPLDDLIRTLIACMAEPRLLEAVHAREQAAQAEAARVRRATWPCLPEERVWCTDCEEVVEMTKKWECSDENCGNEFLAEDRDPCDSCGKTFTRKMADEVCGTCGEETVEKQRGYYCEQGDDCPVGGYHVLVVGDVAVPEAPVYIKKMSHEAFKKATKQWQKTCEQMRKDALTQDQHAAWTAVQACKS